MKVVQLVFNKLDQEIYRVVKYKFNIKSKGKKMKKKTFIYVLFVLAITLSFVNAYTAINTCYAYAHCLYPSFNGVECDRNSFNPPLNCYSCTASCTSGYYYGMPCNYGYVECHCWIYVTSNYVVCGSWFYTVECYCQVGPGDLPG